LFVWRFKRHDRIFIAATLKQSEQFEDNHDNDDYSDYVEDVSVHARDSYQAECVVASIYPRSHDAVIRVYDDSGNVIETHEHKGDFKKS
jgi:hypothetical protein